MIKKGYILGILLNFLQSFLFGQNSLEGTYISQTKPYYYQSDITEILEINSKGEFKYFYMQPVYSHFSHVFTKLKYGEGMTNIIRDTLQLIFKKVSGTRSQKIKINTAPGDSVIFKIKAYPMENEDSVYQNTVVSVLLTSEKALKTISSVEPITFTTSRPLTSDTLCIIELGAPTIKIPILNKFSEVTVTAYLNNPLYFDDGDTMYFRIKPKKIVGSQSIFKMKPRLTARKEVLRWCGEELARKLE